MNNSDKKDSEYDDSWSSALDDDSSYTTTSEKKSQDFKRMHYVDIPAEYTRGDRPTLRIHFGSLNANKVDVKRCYEEMQPRVMNNRWTQHLARGFEIFKCALFNPVVIILFCLAAGVSIYVRALEMCLLLGAQEPYESCEWDTNSLSMEHFATSLGQQMMEGVNSTIWNIDKSAKLYADELVSVYAEASTIMCGAVELAVNDTAQKFMNLYEEGMKKLETETSLYHQALMDVENALSASGLIPSNYTYSLEIPKLNASQVNRSTCQIIGKNQSVYESANKTITDSVNAASRRMNSRPFLDTSELKGANSSCVSIYNDITKRAAAEGQTFIAVFVVLGICLLLSLTIYWMWERNHIHCRHLQNAVDASKRLVKNTASGVSSKAGKSFSMSYLSSMLKLACDRFFSTHMRVLFLISVTLGTASATFETIFTRMTRNLNVSSENKIAVSSIESLYEKYANTINSYSFDTMRTLLGDVHHALSTLNRALISEYGFELSAMTPFSKGVAYAHIDMPYTMKNATIAGNPESQALISKYQNMMLNSFRKLTRYLWITSLVLGIAWIVGCIAITLKNAFSRRSQEGDDELKSSDIKRVESMSVC